MPSVVDWQDDVVRFDEISSVKGALGRFLGGQTMELLLRLAGQW